MSADFVAEPVMVREAPGWVRVLTSCVVAVVAVIALVGSYGHMRHVGVEVGEGWLSYLTPLCVDGLAIAASMVLLVQRRSGQSGGGLARFSQLAALAVSISANIAAAEPTPGARAWGVLPPVVLFLSYELLLQQVRVVTPTQPAATTAPAVPAPVMTAPLALAVEQTGPAAAGGEIKQTAPAGGTSGARPQAKRSRGRVEAPKAGAAAQSAGRRVVSDAQLWTAAVEIAGAVGEGLGRPRLVRELRDRGIPCGTGRAEQLLDRLRARSNADAAPAAGPTDGPVTGRVGAVVEDVVSVGVSVNGQVGVGS